MLIAMGSSFEATLTSVSARVLLVHDNEHGSVENTSYNGDWAKCLSQRVHDVEQVLGRSSIFDIACAAFGAFLQANVTGPPLTWDSARIVLPQQLSSNSGPSLDNFRKKIIASLSVDGEAVYQLIPHVELFCLARIVLNHRLFGQNYEQLLARLRVNFWHQRLLSDLSSTLQQNIYSDLTELEQLLPLPGSSANQRIRAEYLIERATINLYHGFDAKARDDVIQAARYRNFHFALTGRLGKRTKFQEKELSQLVVLAAGSDGDEMTVKQRDRQDWDGNRAVLAASETKSSKPQALSLNDDTLLESISFSSETSSTTQNQPNDALPAILSSLDPGNQPLLHPLDAIILLATASSITNTSPSDGLTREETLPYAERVLSGGSSNWQVYTQALLVRSRIEGHKSRTIERGVLQLQAVVDQVIAETASMNDGSAIESTAGTSFLPQPKPSESASVDERLLYIHQLASPPRWKLEAELADRWISLGGLRTALEIYERLQMWAEVALCWAANDREDKARKVIRRQLYNPAMPPSTAQLPEDSDDCNLGVILTERSPLPADAPRLFCILGDIDKSVLAYERAWEISNFRYARAQRSLGRYYSAAGQLQNADQAYTKSLKVNPQNHQTWFALGCVRLLLEDWAGAVDAFGRAVQIEDTDAESWSNLAVALLRLSPETSASDIGHASVRSKHPGLSQPPKDDEEPPPTVATDPQRHIREAFVALKRAASLKRESFKIWQNLLHVAIRLTPPPYIDIVLAQSRLIDLLGSTEGERCVDAEVVEGLIAHLIELSNQSHNATFNGLTETNGSKGLSKMVFDLVQKKITPLITSSRRLWLLVAKLSLYQKRPAATLSAYEKAWRVTLNKPGWDTGAGTGAARETWLEVKDATVDLVDAYESLGERIRESGLGAGELVAKDWRFKARSALRSILARAKESWEGDEGYEALSARMQESKSF
ncbi:hypothetical protein MMC21_006132 [Puttea exsequens]|nr:hypothetical protein [Puttea exsequens]